MFTPLHSASASGQINVVRLLLDYGVEVDAVSCHGNTSLHIACLNGQDMVASELIAHGAAIDTANNRGYVMIAFITVSLHTILYRSLTFSLWYTVAVAIWYAVYDVVLDAGSVLACFFEK